MNISEFDSTYDLYSVDIKGKIRTYRVSWTKMARRAFKRIAAAVTRIWRRPVSPNLSGLTIGGLQRVSTCTKPSELVTAVLDELHLPPASDSDIPPLYFQWNDELRTITELLRKTNIRDSSVPQPTVEVEPFAALIDYLSRRQGCSWQEASSLCWSEVYLMLLIDKRDYLQQKDMQRRINK